MITKTDMKIETPNVEEPHIVLHRCINDCERTDSMGRIWFGKNARIYIYIVNKALGTTQK